MSKYLVTGCLGYIGSVLCKMLKEQGHTVVGYDPACDTESLHSPYIDHMYLTFYHAIHTKNDLDGIFYLGASSLLNPSIRNPLEYYDNNVGNLIIDLMTINDAGFNGGFVFASSAAVYGTLERSVPVREEGRCIPINPYGSTKLMGEKIIADAQKVGSFNYFNCRFFNVAGAYDDVGQQHDQPHILTALNRAAESPPTKFKQFGNNVRDYIHVKDVCFALMSAMDHLNIADAPVVRNQFGGITNIEEYTRSLKKNCSLNISTGIETSTDELVDAFLKITKTKPIIVKEPPRIGDPIYLIGDNSKTKELLKWAPYYSSLGEIIESAYNYYNKGIINE